MPTDSFDWTSLVVGLGFDKEAFTFNEEHALSTSGSPSAFERFELRARRRVVAHPEDDTLRVHTLDPVLEMSVGDAVTFEVQNGELPEPLLDTETYLAVSPTSDRFSLQTAPSVALDITSTGTGALFVVADPGRFWIDELL